MKSFVVKALIASIIFYVLFEIMIGSRLDVVQDYLEIGKDTGFSGIFLLMDV